MADGATDMASNRAQRLFHVAYETQDRPKALEAAKFFKQHALSLKGRSKKARDRAEHAINLAVDSAAAQNEAENAALQAAKLIAEAPLTVAEERKASPQSGDGMLAAQSFTTTVAGLIDELRSEKWLKKIAYDERADRVLIRAGSPVTALETSDRPYIDNDDTLITEYLARTYGADIAPGNAKLTGAVMAVARQHSFDPVRDYLSALKWDKVKRLDRWLTVYLGAEETPLNRAVGAMWMISAVARSYRPGCQADHVLVLAGAEQGTGKSSTFQVLAVQDDWFSDSISSFDDEKRLGEMVVGAWICELAELSALGKSQIESMKAGITRRTDRYRPAFGRRRVDHPRRFVFGATTNEDDFLRDPTGNRRFWPVRVRGVVEVAGQMRVDLAGLRRDRDQLWAEAVHRFKDGEQWHITDPQLMAAANRAQADAAQRDAWQDTIEEYLQSEKGRTPPGKITRVTVAEILTDAIKTPLHQQTDRETKRVAKCLRTAGWVRRQARDGDQLSEQGGRAKRWAYEPPSLVPSLVKTTGDTGDSGDGSSKEPVTSPVTSNESTSW